MDELGLRGDTRQLDKATRLRGSQAPELGQQGVTGDGKVGGQLGWRQASDKRREGKDRLRRAGEKIGGGGILG